MYCENKGVWKCGFIVSALINSVKQKQSVKHRDMELISTCDTHVAFLHISKAAPSAVTRHMWTPSA